MRYRAKLGLANLTWPFEREAEVYKHSSFALVDIPWLTVQVHVHKKYTTTLQ